jgi:hypothetical protein
MRSITEVMLRLKAMEEMIFGAGYPASRSRHEPAGSRI